jgi:hypothetical protein
MWLYERWQFATAGNVAAAGNLAGKLYEQLTEAEHITLELEAAPKSGVYETATFKLLSGVKMRSK